MIVRGILHNLIKQIVGCVKQLYYQQLAILSGVAFCFLKIGRSRHPLVCYSQFLTGQDTP